MAIRVNLDLMLVKRRITLTQLSERVGVSVPNLSVLKNQRAKAVRFTTLEAICKALDCQPGDVLRYEPDDGDAS